MNPRAAMLVSPAFPKKALRAAPRSGSPCGEPGRATPLPFGRVLTFRHCCGIVRASWVKNPAGHTALFCDPKDPSSVASGGIVPGCRQTVRLPSGLTAVVSLNLACTVCVYAVL